MSTLVAIVMTEAKAAGEGIEDFEEMCRACMTIAAEHWMVLDEDEQFRGAIAAILMLADEEHKSRVKYTVKMLKGLNAATSGVPVYFEALVDFEVKMVPIVKWWQEIKHPEES